MGGAVVGKEMQCGHTDLKFVCNSPSTNRTACVVDQEHVAKKAFHQAFKLHAHPIVVVLQIKVVLGAHIIDGAWVDALVWRFSRYVQFVVF